MNQTHASIESPRYGQLEAVFCAVLLLLITVVIPYYFKTWFVEPTGNIKIAPFFGFVAAVGILFRRNWAHTAAIALAVFVLVLSAFSAAGNPGKPGFWVLSTLSILLLSVLHFSRRLKQYFR